MVFAIGYGKLFYTNRLMRKQEVVDEEKRIRIRELRSSGQIVDSRKSHDVPFGVRAIQSGIQVDGIWISHGHKHIPSDLKLDHLRGSSVDIDNEDTLLSSETTSDRPLSSQGRPPLRSTNSSDFLRTYEVSDTDRPTSAGTRTSYKPRKSSHLRQGSHGYYDEDTLTRLEGTSPASKRKLHTHKPRSSRPLDLEADSSAADNERSSTGASSDSEASLSHKPQEPTSSSPQLLESGPDVWSTPALTFNDFPTGQETRASLLVPGSNADYTSIPLDSPQSETRDPFETPLMSPLGTIPTSRAEDPFLPLRASSPGDYQALPSQPSRSPPPFVPGELHLNKMVRKVNSGFEVLPAGTFGVTPEFKGKGLELDDDDRGNRRLSRLQKKQRTSTSGRISSTFERP